MLASSGMIAAYLTVITLCGEPVFVSGADENGRVLSSTVRNIYQDYGLTLLFLNISKQLPTVDGEPVVFYEEVGTPAQCPKRTPA